MNELSIGASLAWQIAAKEVATAKHQYIEKEHILIGICSLKKVVMLGGRDTQAQQALQAEYNAIGDRLRAFFKLDAIQLRRQVRERLGKGNYDHTEKIIHRSEACKKVFKRADELAASTREISCLYLLAAILENPGNIIGCFLNEVNVNAVSKIIGVYPVAEKNKQDIPSPPQDLIIDLVKRLKKLE